MIDGIPSDLMALVVSKFRRTSSTSTFNMLSSDNIVESSLSMGGAGWHDDEVNTIKKCLLKREAFAKSDRLNRCEIVMNDTWNHGIELKVC